MATVTITQSGIFRPDYLATWMIGGIESASALAIEVYIAQYSTTSYNAIYRGNFSFNFLGEVSGTLTGFDFGYKTTPFLSITGLSVSASAAFALIASGDALGLTALMLGGNDVINAQEYQPTYGSQIIDGFGGNDLVYGSRGTDDISGGLGKDTLWGALNDDSLQGGADDDLLIGEAGHDLLRGDQGADVLSGGWDNDTLIGGTGADQLYGGLGADRFVWTALRDTAVAAPGRDLVQDFSTAEGDKIDLSALDAKAGVKGNQAFTLVDAFTGQKGELRIQSTSAGSVVFADTNGDGSADFAIGVLGTTALSLNDFLL